MWPYEISSESEDDQMNENTESPQNYEEENLPISGESVESDADAKAEISPIFQPATSSQPEEKAPDESSFSAKTGRFARNALIGLGIVVFIFFAGFLTDHFVRYQPMSASLASDVQSLENELSEARQRVSELEGENESLSGSLATANSQVASLENENENLRAELDMAEMHILLLHTLEDFNAANIALANGDISGAKVALINTSNRIERLKPLIATVDAVLAENLPSRLSLVLSAMETDPETARADLDLLAKNILNIEKLVFAQ
jgi:hypothetical protein